MGHLHFIWHRDRLNLNNSAAERNCTLVRCTNAYLGGINLRNGRAVGQPVGAFASWADHVFATVFNEQVFVGNSTPAGLNSAYTSRYVVVKYSHDDLLSKIFHLATLRIGILHIGVFIIGIEPIFAAAELSRSVGRREGVGIQGMPSLVQIDGDADVGSHQNVICAVVR